MAKHIPQPTPLKLFILLGIIMMIYSLFIIPFATNTYELATTQNSVLVMQNGANTFTHQIQTLIRNVLAISRKIF